MRITDHTRYTMTVRSHGAYSVVGPKGTSHFTKPATQSGPKIYLVGLRGRLHYVGVANCTMSRRIWRGLKAKGKNGYHGYEWKSIRAPLTLDVICWSGAGSDLKALEAVEAEVAFLCRTETGQWPLSQTEIHFRRPDDSHKALAHAQSVFAIFKDARVPLVRSTTKRR